MGVRRERISRILKQREKLLSSQAGFRLVSAAVVCAIVESISVLESSSVISKKYNISTNLIQVTENLYTKATSAVLY